MKESLSCCFYFKCTMEASVKILLFQFFLHLLPFLLFLLGDIPAGELLARVGKETCTSQMNPTGNKVFDLQNIFYGHKPTILQDMSFLHLMDF